MSPLTEVQTELQIAVSRAETRASDLTARLGRRPRGMQDAGDLLDHRAAVTGDIADALDRVQPGLGVQWFRALYPEVEFEADLP
ncbi:hypothetical protein MASR1M6_00150 [Rubrivivax sp.]